jgi:hypothetical protein
VLYFYQKLLQNARLPPETKEKIRGCRYATLYTKQQMRDLVNTLSALIVILRNSDVAVLLNRIGSNPVEHAFGKARLYSQDIHTTKTFMSRLAAEFLKLHGGNGLQLVTVARERTLVGGNSEPRTQVNPLPLDFGSMNVEACFFELAGLPISLVYQSVDDVPRDRYLSEIAESLQIGIRPLKPCSPISGSREQHVTSLSSNQSSLSVFQSLGATV